MLIKTVHDFRRAVRHGPYAWPGGYPCYFVMSDGEALSFAAAKAETRNILVALATPQLRDDWAPVALEVNWEDNDLHCAHTNERIPSAYGND